MKTIVELNLSHGLIDIAQISKSFELPTVFGDEGLKSLIKLTDSVSIMETLKPASIDLESNIVTVQKIFSVDITEHVVKEALNNFVKELEIQNWSVQVNQDAIDKLNEPPKPKAVIKNEEIVKQKPKLINWLYQFLSVLVVFSLTTYFFNKENFSLVYMAPFLPFLLVGTLIGHFMSVRQYNKAKEKLEEQKEIKPDLIVGSVK